MHRLFGTPFWRIADIWAGLVWGGWTRALLRKTGWPCSGRWAEPWRCAYERRWERFTSLDASIYPLLEDDPGAWVALPTARSISVEVASDDES